MSTESPIANDLEDSVNTLKSKKTKKKHTWKGDTVLYSNTYDTIVVSNQALLIIQHTIKLAIIMVLVFVVAIR